MAEEHTNKVAEFESNVGGDHGAVESKDRGMFDFLGKKEEEQPKPQQEAIATEFENFKIEESKAEDGYREGEKKNSLLEKLHRSHSSSSSSSDEEEGESGEKKKKKKNKDKKGLKEKIEEKIGGDKKADDTAVPVEKSDEQPEKKGLIDKIKEKLPGVSAPSPPPTPAAVAADKVAVEHHEEESKEKKGFLEKIKEKMPGYHSKTEDEKETTASR
ncbi:hypothetical protein V6N13_082864 [Hibiscus sabdariffa]|uniref:Dehydrin n=1 Tax=Hibiscus sabdariffa TaxID=183260 RepID=A0ABR2BZQ4_9ROSI